MSFLRKTTDNGNSNGKSKKSLLSKKPTKLRNPLDSIKGTPIGTGINSIGYTGRITPLNLQEHYNALKQEEIDFQNFRAKRSAGNVDNVGNGSNIAVRNVHGEPIMSLVEMFNNVTPLVERDVQVTLGDLLALIDATRRQISHYKNDTEGERIYNACTYVLVYLMFCKFCCVNNMPQSVFYRMYFTCLNYLKRVGDQYDQYVYSIPSPDIHLINDSDLEFLPEAFNVELGDLISTGTVTGGDR